jgi:hypothetical protein
MALVAAEIALTLMLLIGAGLMINSFMRLIIVQPGFEARNVLVVPLDLPPSRYTEPQRRREFVERAVAEMRTIPGVTAAGAVSHLPLGGADSWMSFAIEGRPVPRRGQEPYAPIRVATPDYFRALGIPLRRGRVFSDSDARIAVPLIAGFRSSRIRTDSTSRSPRRSRWSAKPPRASSGLGKIRLAGVFASSSAPKSRLSEWSATSNTTG